jgi:Hypothetical protein (DUF2513).
MTRDVHLLRAILFRAETTDVVVPWPDHDSELVAGHLQLMKQAGYVEVVDSSTMRERRYQAWLTWSGHDLLDAIRSDDVWREIIEQCGEHLPFTLIERLAFAKAAAKVTREELAMK